MASTVVQKAAKDLGINVEKANPRILVDRFSKSGRTSGRIYKTAVAYSGSGGGFTLPRSTYKILYEPPLTTFLASSGSYASYCPASFTKSERQCSECGSALKALNGDVDFLNPRKFRTLFMLYALVQFTRESKRKLGPRDRGSYSRTRKMLAHRD